MGMSNGVYQQKMSVEEAYKRETEVCRMTAQKFSLPVVSQAMNIQENGLVTMLKLSECSNTNTDAAMRFKKA
jgi:hypothetical protein